jgi:hypothetical protein
MGIVIGLSFLIIFIKMGVQARRNREAVGKPPDSSKSCKACPQTTAQAAARSLGGRRIVNHLKRFQAASVMLNACNNAYVGGGV